MKKRIPLSETFRALREMPPEVSLDQVRAWVREGPRSHRTDRHWLPLLLARYWKPWSKN